MSLLLRLWTWLFDREVPCEQITCPEPVRWHDTVLDFRYCDKHARQEVPHEDLQH